MTLASPRHHLPGQQGCARYEVNPWQACMDGIAKAGQIDYHNLAYALVLLEVSQEILVYR
ncbi:hypothetical protein [Cupriavidus necator]|uniref:hypothetical protein n=1 Tax=Cupriavidus necator TaxID=106590 RepID=UPI00339D4160